MSDYQPTLRSYILLRDTAELHLDWDLRPVHFAGMAVFISNSAITETAQIFVDTSADGATWTPLTFSTPASSGNLSVTLQPLAKGMISFENASNYVRLRLANTVEEGVRCWAVQFPPLPREPVAEAYA
jgi:hypothetical protein